MINQPLNLVFLLSLLLSCKHTDTNKKRSSVLENPARITMCSTRVSDIDWYSANSKAPKFKGLDKISFTITTNSSEAQEYFNQGLMLSYGFNHAEAARSFYESIRLDSSCAMCHWGYAYVLGPNYNAGMESDNFQRAYIASQKALSLLKNCTEKEKDLIRALTSRYALNPPEDRKTLDMAYSDAMKSVYEKYATDADVGALYAESMMDLHPWDLYEKTTKAPKEWTPALWSVLEHLMKINPTHPGAHHFYIHAVEASASPEKGLASAHLLKSLVPGSGHLVHMPSHIYINTGDYHLGSESNIKAMQVDSHYTTTCHAQGVYPLAYFPHNIHFLSATATLEGNKKMAWDASNKLQKQIAKDIMRQPGWGTLQHYYTIPYYIATKFGMWDTILAIPMPDADLIYPQAVLHYARGLADVGLNRIADAEIELAKLTDLSSDTILKDLTIWDINSTVDLLRIATLVLSAEIASSKKQYDESISMFTKAVASEDQLNYQEPPDWFFSVRHHLGAVCLKAGKFKDAENIYIQDLKTWKKNGWALLGLYHALKGQGKKTEAEKIKKEFDKAWKYSDTKIASSVML